MRDLIRSEVERALKSVCGSAAGGFDVETPRRKEFGDFSTNAAMTLAKKRGENPRDLAGRLAEFLDSREMFEKVEVAGPGFVNFFMKPAAVVSNLPRIAEQAERFGAAPARDETVLLEFVSANPTGPLHFGHARGAVVGDALGKILKFAGYGVAREFYINDAGGQMEMLGKSVLARLENTEIPEDGYGGEYITEIARGMEKGADAETCAKVAYGKLLGAIRDDLATLGVEFDEWVSEKERIHASGALERATAALRGAGAVREEDGAQWFSATEYGDSQDWVLIKRDGSPTYFVADIAYHMDKFSRNYNRLVNIWGADHHSHAGRLGAAMRALGLDDKKLNTLLIQFVRLVRDGKEESMGKRAGSYVTLREVAELVGADVTRFFLLMRATESHLDFDLELARRTSNENPVYYVQYAHARTASIRRKAAEKGLAASPAHLELLCRQQEVDLAAMLLAFPDVVSDSARDLAPHKVVFYLQGLASAFHSYYNANRVIGEDGDLSAARMFLCECAATVLRNGLKLVGITAPERM